MAAFRQPASSDSPRFRPLRSVCALAVLIGMLGGAWWLLERRSASAQNGPAPNTTRSAPSAAQENPSVSTDQSPKAPDAENPFEKPVENPFPNRVKAPSLDGGVGWLNTSGEITLKDLRGKVVLLDFWTYCCINCMHVLPDLAFLEEKYANDLVVIGVHSAKFDNEKDSQNIRRAILRYEIKHPVINDATMTLWRKFGARSWPSLVLIDPEGYYCGYVSGEGNRELLDLVIGKLVAYHKSKGTLDTTPVRFDLERNKQQPTPLKFPGKILADEAGRRLFIADSNHNRMVIATLDGRLLDVVGAGVIGAQDGSFDEASFDHPQGMTLVGETLYVADTENHLIRAIDLKQKAVSTLAGTGKQDRRRSFGGALRETPLNSPWDLLAVKGTLYVAMAGAHQVWRHTLGTDSIAVYAGSGREDILNGPLREAALAQPSGLTTDGTSLFVADSEGSAIRRIPLKDDGNVTTVAGTSDLPLGRSLFEFGDRDGAGSEARLQHPLGIVYHHGTLYVADTYNHKIKKVALKDDPAQVTTVWGTGQRGDSLTPPQFSEPGGISLAGDTLYIADTNNHRIVTADLKTGTVVELVIAGLEPPQPPRSAAVDPPGSQKVIAVNLQRVASGEALRFEVPLHLPEGYKLNKQAPVTYRLAAPEEQPLIAAKQLGGRHQAQADESSVHFAVPLARQSGKATLDVIVSYVYCRDGVGGLCKLKTARWRVPVEVSPNASQTTIPLPFGG